MAFRSESGSGAWLAPVLAALSFAGVFVAFVSALLTYRGSVRGWAEQDLQSRADLAAVLLAEPLHALDFRAIDDLGARYRAEGLRLRIVRGREERTSSRGFYDTERGAVSGWLFRSAETEGFTVFAGRPEAELTRPFRRAYGVIALAGLAGVTGVLLFFFVLWRQRLRLREMMRLEKFRREFIADVSHEIKTPLTGILGAADLMDENDPLAGLVKREGRRLNALVQQILDLARLERSGEVLHRAETDLGELAHAVAARQGIPCEAPACVVRCDAALVEEALENLVVNAKRHSGSDEIRVRLVREGATARLAVEDRGCGIPPEHAARIFERFYRADPSRTASSGGAGLGLAIVRRIARLHGGEATYAPAKPHGSVFTISLPVTS